MARTTGSNGDRTALAVRTASLRLFAQSGYAAVSMRTIADAVGIQASAIYNHFPTKQAILYAILKTHMTDLLAPQSRLDAFARFHIRYHLSRPDEVFLSYMELRALEPDNFAAITHLRDRYEAVLLSILNEANLGAPAPRITARALLAMLTGVNTWYREDGQMSPAEIEDLYAGMVLRSVQHEKVPAHV